MNDIVERFRESLRGNARLRECGIDADLERPGVLRLRGLVDEWRDVTDAGFLAGKIPGVRSVVNLIECRNHKAARESSEARARRIAEAREKGVVRDADVVIVGCGISGAAIARTLAAYELDIVVVEKKNDVSEGTTKANNGMVHPGHDPRHGTLKALLNVEGNAGYTRWAEELGFSFTRPGLLLNIFDESQDRALQDMYENAILNGVPGARLVSGEEAASIEPRLGVPVRRAMWLPTAGFVEPHEVVAALMENALDNGVGLMLETEVLDIETGGGAVSAVVTDRGVIRTGMVINAAGLYADEVADMAGDMFYTIHPRKGALLIFDRVSGSISTDASLGVMPSAHSKGGGNMKTPTGNPLWGPSAKEVPDKEDTSVDRDELDEVIGKVFTQGISERDLIAFFDGVRAPVYTEDFIIEPSERVDGFIHVAGIQSPGLASAPGIARMVRDIVLRMRPGLRERADYNPYRRAPVKFSALGREEQSALVEREPKYGHIVCRCETVSEGEVLDAIHGRIPAGTMDAVKRRTRCGMGRCGGGFCGPRVMELLARETGTPLERVTKRGAGSEMLLSENRRVPS